ncbi:MAG: hypothetical protein C0490_00360 [Marivirga sp.]|nr:hypothetical protein [Marivirga sp.]
MSLFFVHGRMFKMLTNKIQKNEDEGYGSCDIAIHFITGKLIANFTNKPIVCNRLLKDFINITPVLCEWSLLPLE